MTGTGGRRSSRRVLVTCMAVLALALALALAGCGDETSPGDAVPALANRLDQVDQAIEAGDYTAARAQLDRLVAETARADVAGRISDEQADRILKAVDAVLAGLPAAEGGSDPPSEPESPADLGNPDADDGTQDEKDEKDEKDKKDKDGNDDKDDD